LPMNEKAFTLIEVLVSVVLIFIIGMTLTKVSSQNTNTLYAVKHDFTFLDSAALNSDQDYKDINDYIKIQDIPKFNYRIEKKEDIIGESVLPITDQFMINYTLKKEELKSEKSSHAYFRIQ
jgi:hypothetical protein